jgi:hypothetical protein
MNGMVMVGLPDSTVELINKISVETGLSFVDVISESIRNFGISKLQKEKEENPKENQKPKIGFRR